MEFVGALFGVVVVDCAALHVPQVFAPILDKECFNISACLGQVAE